jgi:signal transduction histidine kinase
MVEAENLFHHITEEYGKYTLAKNLGEIKVELKQYERSLSALIGLHENDGTIKVSINTLDNLENHHKMVEQQGRKLTTELEDIVKKERRHVQGLIEKSKTYHTIALAAIFILSILTMLFLIINVNRPLQSIEDAVFHIAQGHYEKIPKISTGDEFESLAISLNTMIDELNKRNELIVQSEKLASIGTLTSGVAHELNNPLNNISTSIQILLEELDENIPEFKKELLEETEKQIERARDTVKALLEFSRDRSFRPEAINFKELVDQTIKLIKAEVPASINLTMNIPEGLQVNLDPQRIQQVLINLIVNAVHAMGDGGDLTIRAFMRKEKKEFCFQVQDTGKGIPEENLSKIFDPFFTTKEVGMGTGLGLSTSHGFVERHGGRFEVESKAGKGTTFTIILPQRTVRVAGFD